MDSGQGKSRRLGCEVPRIFTPPLRELTEKTSAGFSVIRFAEMIGIELYPWQKWLLIHMMELDGDRFRFRTVIILVGRQNGKSTVMKVLALWCMYVRGWRLVLGTAQDLETAEQLWAETVEIAEDSPELAAEIAKIHMRNGARALELVGGERYQVKAATRRGGRGKAAKLVILDELREHQNWQAWAAISNTTLAQEDALVVAPSNAGDVSSVVLAALRRAAHMALGDPDKVFEDLPSLDWDMDGAGDEPESLAIFEWSAPPDAGMWDRAAWAQGNPSLNVVTSNGRNALPEQNLVAAARAAAASSEARQEFLIEVMGQWQTRAKDSAFPDGAWAGTLDSDSRVADDAVIVYGVDVAWDKTGAAVAWAGLRPDGDPHVEIIGWERGQDWVVPWFRDRAARDGEITVVLQGRGAPVSVLADDIAAIEGVEVVRLVGSMLGDATGRLWNLIRAAAPGGTDSVPRAIGDTSAAVSPELLAVTGRRLHRLAQPPLDMAANFAVLKVTGDGTIYPDRVKSPVDISPLVAAMCAVWAVTRPEIIATSAYDDNDLLVL